MASPFILSSYPTTGEKIITAFFWCSVGSLVLVAWDGHRILFNSVVSIVTEILSMFKIFGIALSIVISIGAGIAIWEQVIEKSNIWNKANKIQAFSSVIGHEPITPSQQEPPQDRQPARSIVPIVVVIAVLTFVAITDASICFSSTSNTMSRKPVVQCQEPSQMKRQSRTLISSGVIQFSSAVLTLGTVIGLIVFSRDEYHVWKARRKLIKHNRRRAREG